MKARYRNMGGSMSMSGDRLFREVEAIAEKIKQKNLSQPEQQHAEQNAQQAAQHLATHSPYPQEVDIQETLPNHQQISVRVAPNQSMTHSGDRATSLHDDDRGRRNPSYDVKKRKSSGDSNVYLDA